MYYHYRYTGRSRHYTRKGNVIKAVLCDMVSDMPPRLYEERDIRTVRLNDRLTYAPLNRPFILTVIDNKPVFVMKSEQLNASITERISHPELFHGGDWYLVDLARRKVLRFFTSTDLAAAALISKRAAVMSVHRRKPFNGGRYLIARSSAEATIGLTRYDKPTRKPRRRIVSIESVNTMTGVTTVFDGTRALAEALQCPPVVLRNIIHRATDLLDTSICTVRPSMFPEYVFYVTYDTGK